jgi:copper chaperone NosL
MTMSAAQTIAILGFLGLFGACNRGNSEKRCGNCGMKLDSASAFHARAESVTGTTRTREFDSPKCALAARKADETVMVQEYYSRTWTNAADTSIAFVGGSNVLGPMGHDLIPVAKTNIDKFMKDHAGARQLSMPEIPPTRAMDLAE